MSGDAPVPATFRAHAIVRFNKMRDASNHLIVRGSVRGKTQLLAKHLIKVEHGRRIVDIHFDPNRLVGTARHPHRFNRRRRDGVNIDLARADGLARTPLGHVQCVGNFDDTRLECQAALVHVVRQHRVHHLRDDHRQLRLDINRRELAP